MCTTFSNLFMAGSEVAISQLQKSFFEKYANTSRNLGAAILSIFARELSLLNSMRLLSKHIYNLLSNVTLISLQAMYMELHFKSSRILSKEFPAASGLTLKLNQMCTLHNALAFVRVKLIILHWYTLKYIDRHIYNSKARHYTHFQFPPIFAL